MFFRKIASLGFCFLLATPQLGIAKEEMASQQPTYLEEVTVTANKQEENIQKIPTSISAFSDVQLEDANMNFVQDLAKRVPNLGFYTGGTNIINFPTMRGVRSDPHNNISSVAMYIDDIPITSNLGFVADLYDIERVEVLRGPQGTLYGRSSIGGVINVITKRPDNTWRSKTTVEAGTEDMYHIKGDMAGPLINDTLFFGFSGNTYSQTGVIKNDYDGENTDDKKDYSGRGKLRFTPNDDLEITLLGSYFKSDEGSLSMYSHTASDDRRVNTDTPGHNQTTLDEQALNIKYKINDDWTISSVSSRRFTDSDYMVDYDFSTAKTGQEIFNVSKYEDLSQELRFSYENSGTNILFGAYADKYTREMRVDFPYSPMPTFRSHRAKDVTENYSLFTHIKYPLSEKLHIIGGLRYDIFNTDFENKTTKFSDEKTWTSLSPKAAVEYQLTQENMLYASVSHGYRIGGFSGLRMAPGSGEFDEENLWAYEVGSKNTFWDKSVKANFALFVNDIKDGQIEAYERTPAGFMPYATNAGDMTAYGAELELSWFPIDSLELFGTAGYTHLRFDNFEDAHGNHEDNRLPYVPDYTFSIGSQYRHKSGFFAHGEILGSSKTYLDSANTHAIPWHAVVNTKIGWEFDKLDLYLFAKNLLDKEYDYKGAFGGDYDVASPPATMGIGFTYNFF